MGGIRYINGFPTAAPRMHISLGDSLAGMFATQGILAAVYWRDVAGGGLGQVVDVSLMESSFALLESTVPEYDRLGIVRGPQGTNLKGIAPSNIFRSRDEKWMVIAANADNVFGRLCGAIGRPELATDERFATHLARGTTRRAEGIVAAWAGERSAAEIDEVLNDAGVIAADLHDRGHLRRRAPRAREMLTKHVDPVGEYIGPGIIPPSETPGELLVGDVDEGSHNDVHGLLGLSGDELAQLKEDGVL
jgi:formyl-CoA transferase